MSKTIRHRKEKRINAISVRSNVILLIVLTLLAALCVLPVLLVVNRFLQQRAEHLPEGLFLLPG